MSFINNTVEFPFIFSHDLIEASADDEVDDEMLLSNIMGRPEIPLSTVFFLNILSFLNSPKPDLELNSISIHEMKRISI